MNTISELYIFLDLDHCEQRKTCAFMLQLIQLYKDPGKITEKVAQQNSFYVQLCILFWLIS